MIKKIQLFVLFLLIGIFSNAQEKYAIGMFHFNLQYVAGDYRIERRIIIESFYPVLQFFEKNPSYRSDIEIQGFAIEVLAEEHPQVLALLKKLIDRGQIELVIAHYSDQLFIAYPALDLQKSIELSDEILTRYGVKRSKVFFGQEIQFTPAFASVLKGKYNLFATSSDPHGYYRDSSLPLVNLKYGKDEILGIIGGGEKKLNGLEWDWAFLDDGEVFNTNDYNSNFYRVAKQEKESMDRFLKLKSDGYQFLTMTELADKIKKLKGYVIPDYPFVPEGTWNMDVCGPFMWMGRQRSGVETDGLTRSLSYELRGRLMAIEKLVEYAESKGTDVSDLKKLVKEAWKHLLLSEVSDSSGWSPWLVEVQYTANEVANANLVLNDLINKLKTHFLVDGKSYIVDTGSGKITLNENPLTGSGTASLLPIPFGIKAEKATTAIRKINENLYRLDIKCERPADGAIEIVFDTPADGLQYSAGAGEAIAVQIPADLKHDPSLALSNGFIWLNNGYSLVKDCSVEHLAATWKVMDRKLVFREELNPDNKEMNMRFYVIRGTVTDGLELGNRLNTWPSYSVKVVNHQMNIEKIMPENRN